MTDSPSGLVAIVIEKLAEFEDAFADWDRLERALEGLDPLPAAWCRAGPALPESASAIPTSIWEWLVDLVEVQIDKAAFLERVVPLVGQWPSLRPLVKEARRHGTDVAVLRKWSLHFDWSERPQLADILAVAEKRRLQRRDPWSVVQSVVDSISEGGDRGPSGAPDWNADRILWRELDRWSGPPDVRLVLRPAVAQLLEEGTLEAAEITVTWEQVSDRAEMFEFQSGYKELVKGPTLLARLARATAPTAYTTSDFEAAIEDLHMSSDSLVPALKRLAKLYVEHRAALGDLYYWLYLASAGGAAYRYHDALEPVVRAAELVVDLDANGQLEPQERNGELVVALTLAHTDRQLRALTFELRRWARTGVRSEVLDRLLERMRTS